MAIVTMKITMKNDSLTLETAVNSKLELGNAQIVYAMTIRPGIPFWIYPNEIKIQNNSEKSIFKNKLFGASGLRTTFIQ
jgi:hypothetical protein